MNKHTNPNDLKVVEFHNKTDFDFTPELGAIYDSRPLFVKSGEKKQLPYHVGHRLAVNLAKQVLVRGASAANPNDPPTGKPLWSTDELDRLKNSYLTELYTEEKPVAQSETDRLMERVAMLEAKFKTEEKTEAKTTADGSKYKDKQEVINELEARGIKHDKRSKKEELEKLLVA